MTLVELLQALERMGAKLEAKDNRLSVDAPKQKLTPALRSALTAHKAVLLQLLEPKRDTSSGGCPLHWERVPELPVKGAQVRMVDPQGYGARYRVKLFGNWYLVKFMPPFDGRVSLTDFDHRTRVFMSLEEAYRWAWAETWAGKNIRGGADEWAELCNESYFPRPPSREEEPSSALAPAA